MTMRFKFYQHVVFLALLSLGSFVPAAFARSNEVCGFPQPGAEKCGCPSASPAHCEFIPIISNMGADSGRAAGEAASAEAAYSGQDWETDKWPDGWTPETALQKFFQGRIFARQYMRYDQIPVVELGPVFYQLSELDQRRTLKLLAEHTSIFRQGYKAVELVDWSTHDVMGAYTPDGLFLN